MTSRSRSRVVHRCIHSSIKAPAASPQPGHLDVHNPWTAGNLELVVLWPDQPPRNTSEKEEPWVISTTSCTVQTSRTAAGPAPRVTPLCLPVSNHHIPLGDVRFFTEHWLTDLNLFWVFYGISDGKIICKIYLRQVMSDQVCWFNKVEPSLIYFTRIFRVIYLWWKCVKCI